MAADTCAHRSGKGRAGVYCISVVLNQCAMIYVVLNLSFFLQLLSFPLGDCPRYKQLMSETEHTEEFINFTTENKVQSPFSHFLLLAALKESRCQWKKMNFVDFESLKYLEIRFM